MRKFFRKTLTAETATDGVIAWSEAMTRMNDLLGDIDYEFAENTGDDKATRPLVLRKKE